MDLCYNIRHETKETQVMPEIPKIVLPHGGYRKLTCFQKSEVVYQMTIVFCRRFLPAHGDRTVDQAAWSIRKRKGWQ